MGEIKIVCPSKTCGYPYLMCKKKIPSQAILYQKCRDQKAYSVDPDVVAHYDLSHLNLQ